MAGETPITWLMFFTLGAALIVAAGLFISFLRSRHNRELAANALQGDGRSRSGEPSGAGAELIGLFAVAAFAMALLAFGYNSYGGSKVAGANTRAGSNNELATPRTDPNTPKPYQPANPAPDTRAAPTGSTTGQGPDSGGRPEQQPKP
jgi:hypothetical protein